MSRRIKFWEDPKSVLSAANCPRDEGYGYYGYSRRQQDEGITGCGHEMSGSLEY